MQKNYCSPPLTAIPLCLCFDEHENPVGVCNYKEKCTPNGCEKEPSASPFVISFSNNQCIARRGVERLNCVRRGEFSSGEAVCLDHLNRPVTMCGPGQICTADGCSDSKFEFDIISTEPMQVRQDKLRNGFEIVMTGNMRYGEGKTLYEKDKPDLKAISKLGVLDSEQISLNYDGAINLWEVIILSLHFSLSIGSFSSIET